MVLQLMPFLRKFSNRYQQLLGLTTFYPLLQEMKDNSNEFPIEELISTFPNGNKVFVDSEVSLRLSWFPSIPDFSDNIMSDYGVSSAKDSKITENFYAEINAIREIIETNNMKTELPDWQKSDDKVVTRMYTSLSRNSLSYSIWSWYSIPIRHHEGIVYRIWAPSDLMGSPIIKSLPLADFVCLVAEQTAKDKALLTEKKKKENKLKNIVGFLLLIIIILLTVILKKS